MAMMRPSGPADRPSSDSYMGAYRFCPHCGHRLLRRDPTEHPTCPDCGFVHYRNPIAVVAGVLLARGPWLPEPDAWVDPAEATHILLVRRTGTYRGTWCIPCGYVEYGEEIRRAAAREMREETGLLVEAGPILAVHSNFHDPGQLTVGNWFLMKYLGGKLRPGSDADRAELVPIDACPHPLAFPTDELVLADLASGRDVAKPTQQ